VTRMSRAIVEEYAKAGALESQSLSLYFYGSAQVLPLALSSPLAERVAERCGG
jgi:hypothetical protein